jgi:hypothetical protein
LSGIARTPHDAGNAQPWARLSAGRAPVLVRVSAAMVRTVAGRFVTPSLPSTEILNICLLVFMVQHQAEILQRRAGCSLAEIVEFCDENCLAS